MLEAIWQRLGIDDVIAQQRASHQVDLAVERALCAAATALWGSASASALFVVGGVVKIIYDLTLWCLFRQVKPPEEAFEP